MKKYILSLCAILSCACAFAQNATITGVVTDKEYNDYLVGASIIVEGTSIGVVADANGRYTIYVPAGQATVQYSFLGYKSYSAEVDLSPNEVKVINVGLESDMETLEGVVVSAQAKGQTAAINRQLHASGIMNAVSEEKLSELPDVNVADAIGRLPGLMIQRDGGEGQNPQHPDFRRETAECLRICRNHGLRKQRRNNAGHCESVRDLQGPGSFRGQNSKAVS